MQDNIINYGEVSDELCTNCHKCSDYDLSFDYNYTKFISISFRERNHKYFLRCKNCRVYTEINRPKAQYMIDTKFADIERKRKRKLRIKNAVSAMLICAAVIGIAFSLLNDPNMIYKNLIAGKPDGFYEIYDKEGTLWAQVTKQGSMRYDLLVKHETSGKEDYRKLSGGLYEEYYYSEQDGALKYIENNAGALLDKNGVGVRYFFYDSEEKDIFYDFGVDRLSSIAYSENRAVYPMTYYSQENEYYWKVFECSEDREMILLFKDTKGTKGGGLANALKPSGSPDYSADRLQTAEFYILEKGGSVKYEYYDFTGAEDINPALVSLNRQSGLDAAVKALKASGIEPAFSEEFTYYKDTGVAKSIFIRSIDPSTGIKVSNKIDYIVEEKGGYYIVTPDVEKFGEKAA